MNPLPFLADVIVRSSLVLAFVLALQFVLRRASAAEKHVILLLGLAAALLIPAELALGPHLPWAIKVHVRDAGIFLLSEKSEPMTHAPASLTGKQAGDRRAAAPAADEPIAWGELLELLFAAGACAQLLLLARGAQSWRKIRRRAVEPPLKIGALESIRAFAPASGVPPVLVSDDVTVPVLVGSLRPVIILPRDALAGPDAAIEMMLCHEIAHFRRGDALLLPLHWLLRILYWWHPLAWLALARLRREREIACDDLVLSRQFRPSDYAGLILSAARGSRSAIPAGALAMAASAVGRRVASILDPRVRRNPAARWVTLCAGAAALCLAWPLAATKADPAGQTSTVAAGSNAQIRISYDLVLIDLDTYSAYQQSIDPILKSGDLSVISNMPGTYVLSTPAYLANPGKELDFSDTKPMPVPTGFGMGANGAPIATGYRQQDLGPRFTNVATIEPDNQSVKLQFKCALTFFKQWNQLPSGAQKPVIGKEVLWMTKVIHNGHALAVMPRSNRYLPPDNSSPDVFAGAWPQGKDTGPKKMFILINAAPAAANH